MMATTVHGRTLPAWRLAMWGGAAMLLLAPLIAMRFTAEVRWTGTDFLAAAVLLGGAALLIEVAVRTVATARGRTVAVSAILAALVLVWLQGAVGIV